MSNKHTHPLLICVCVHVARSLCVRTKFWMASILLLLSVCSTMAPDSVCSLGLGLLPPQEAISTHLMKMKWEEWPLPMARPQRTEQVAQTLEITFSVDLVYTDP